MATPYQSAGTSEEVPVDSFATANFKMPGGAVPLNAATNSVLPVGVVIPTRNCIALLERHLDCLRGLMPRVEQVVVVDSASTDGTPELLHKELRHPRIEFLQHPPGLYESWNFGVRQVRARYTYIATAGDAITPAGLQSLCAAAEDLKADVVISKPTFCDPEGAALPDEAWPVDDIISTLRLSKPYRLHKIEALLFALTSISSALTGSCASDLFRTEQLQRYPFSPSYGGAGDGAWGLENALNVRWAAVPGRFSQFVRHPKAGSPGKHHGLDGERFEKLARQVIEEGLRFGLITTHEVERFRFEELLDALSRYLRSKTEFDRQRRQSFPWILWPSSWRARNHRNEAWDQLCRLRARALEQCRDAWH